MTEFDDFMQKTERILEVRRVARNAIAVPTRRSDPKVDGPERLQRVTSREWSRLLLSLTDQTSGKSINKDRFLAYGRTGVMLGKVVLVLKPGAADSAARPKYFAEYRCSSPDGGVVKLANVSMQPELSRTPSGKEKILWQTDGLGQRDKLATCELATGLAIKLVDVYQANGI